MSKPDREKRLERDHPSLSIRRQCSLLSLARSGVYRQRHLHPLVFAARCRGGDRLDSFGAGRIKAALRVRRPERRLADRKSTRLNSSHRL